MRGWVLLALLVGCASEPAPDGLSPETVIAEIRMNDVVLVIESGDDGPRYGLTDHDGRILARGLDAAALAALHPDAAEAIDTGVAGAYLDARLDPPQEAPER